MPKKRAATVGLGGAGSVHVSTMQRYFSDEIELVAVCDKNTNFIERLQEVRKANETWSQGHSRNIDFGADMPNFYTDHNDMLRNEQLDLVTVATRSDTHMEIVYAVAHAGVPHILCEKPISTDIQSARNVVHYCKARNLHLGIHHERRWLPEYREVHKLIKSGAIGELRSLTISCGGARTGDIMVHFTDFVRFLTDSDYARAIGYLDPISEVNPRDKDGVLGYADPPGFAVFEMLSGVIATISVRANVALPPSFFIEGTRGRMYIGEQHEGGEWVGLQRTEKKVLSGTLDYYGVMHPIPGFPTAITKEHGESEFLLSVGLKDLLEGKPSCTGEDGLKAYEALVAAYVSHHSVHIPVSLPITDNRWLTRKWPHA